MKIIEAPSPNQNKRRFPVDMLVLHYTGMEDGPSALERMRDEKAQVSAHYMVDVDGFIYQLVPEDMRAWHAGVSNWQGDGDLNSRSVGIEIVNGGHNVKLPDGSLQPYSRVQIEAVIELSRAIIERHKIPMNRVVGHSDIAPDRKDDPGEHFPWEEFAARGVGFWPELPKEGEPTKLSEKDAPLKLGAKGKGVTGLQEDLQAIGYPIEVSGAFDEQTEKVVMAFQRRWNQGDVSGVVDPLTFELIRRVAALASAR
ncbi:N-acetylmuramoyl-L-alanine amidase [Ponticaulis sp.]|uniref:peptidoglycan recognition protein family protein n=1 Tax=Ponticaulis sp. TaxID=2020902 RepID=UPI000B63E5DA|nr:N-acetylmuramoyl-L-alanine amidase [Ponticaulis sp.]MAJ09057.1 N-acetylmuramoyl-L-alanine amidase [Ponticaulis sp.]RPG16849.1 MAG: N-acetylmuramoyl-L-alanine amidase [Hyphomonadaceae bacterium TMED125]HBJ93122.1 N-acetylmuramoyl-L-alanine amidase [Hyphomonadaceae bacterium]|tara:strand:+ start:10252 stop:11016 length:765 start_codon:yes stop_codon:yes gene_type:complete